MSTKRTVSAKAVSIPEGVQWLEFERSDGDPNTWPPKSRTERVVDGEGHVNFHRVIAPDEGSAVRWRVEVGAAVASRMGLPAGPNYVLRSWPSGYQLYDHHKGPQADPRHDLYLFGPKGIRFRSVNEFVPHAFWLMNPQTACDCKYCTKRPQREISFALGLSHRPASSSPAPGRMRPGHNAPKLSDRRHRDQNVRNLHKPYAAVQRTPKSAKDRAFSGKSPKYSMSRQRNSDLRAVYSENGMLLKRWFREGELLWCALDKPIPGRVPDEDIICWPALVQEIILRPEAIRSEGGDSEMHDVADVGGAPSEAVVQPMVASDATCPWTVRQSIFYRLKLLAVHHSACFADNRVLPYQAYVMSAELRHAIENYAMDTVDLNPDVVHTFDPRTPSEKDPPSATVNRTFEKAVGAYALALQTAAHIATFWCPTDEWEFKYTAPGVLPPATVGESSIANAIAEASTANAALQASGVSMNPENPLRQGDHVTRILGQLPPPSPIPQTVSQLRYQGLWWGSERIWMDDLVRLKVARKHLAPNGNKDILPPAGPSQSSTEYHAKVTGVGPESHSTAYGAEERGVFMKIDGLFVVEVPREGDKNIMECRISGMLYELADQDWIDPGENTDAKMTAEVSTDSAGQLSGSILTPTTSAQTQVIGPSLLPPSASDTITQESSSDSVAKPPASHDQLSHPRTGVSDLPIPPKGYKFRHILIPGSEAVMSLTLISGRYYPQLLAHPLLQPCLHRAIGSNVERGLQEGQHLWALEGLAPGYFNAIDPTKASPDRLSMVKESERLAREEVQRWQEVLVNARGEKLDVGPDEGALAVMDDGMEVEVEPSTTGNVQPVLM